MRRSCERCGEDFEAQTARARFCGSTCRARKSEDKAADTKKPDAPLVEHVGSRLAAELTTLDVIDTYEAQIALGIARQLDNGAVIGAAYSSLSKELDRRVDALRLKAERKDNPVVSIKGRLEEKRAAFA